MEDSILNQANNEFTSPDIPFNDESDIGLINITFHVPTINTNEYNELERNEPRRKASVAEEIEMVRNYEIQINREDTICETDRKRQVIKSEKYKYIGETLGDNRDGFGICHYTNGEIHIGQWKNNLKEGYGKTIFTNGIIYQGEMRNNHFEGFCEKIDKNGTHTTGYALRGMFIDEIVIQNGDKITEKRLDSNIVKIKSKNKYYYGENNIIIAYKDDFPTLAGFMINFKLNGYGEIYHKEGSKFYGNFVDNKKNGIGIFLTKDNKVLIGDYTQDLKNGAFFIITKTSFKMEIYHYGFRSKTIDKYENCKKYLILNYPEFSYLLKLDFKKLVDKLTDDL
jgi:hypothetical protein